MSISVTLPPAIAVYVHWPFCKSKCPYCDFNSHVREAVDHQRWLEALRTELDHVAALTGPRRVSSIFFGGGTPSLMRPSTVEGIIARAEAVWGLEEGCEITLEANPTSVESDAFRDFRAAGVNRVSIGVQSLVDADLHALGRTHSAAEARAALAIAARVFDRFSFDLIYARPHQRLESWRAELDEAVARAGDHLSLYQLTMEPGTQFFTLHRSGRLPLPDDEASAAFYDLTQSVLEAAGMPAYEVSNHARPGRESKHNLTYWRYGAYAGIGPGAHGRIDIGGVRHATRAHRAPEAWLAMVEGHGHGYHPMEAVDARTAFEERLMMGLRLREGVTLTESDRLLLNAQKIALLQKEGLLLARSDRLVPTKAGRLVLTALTAALLAG